MSDKVEQNNKGVEQITKEPITPLLKVKDPKKLAAGKKLAEYNRKVKETTKTF